MTGYHQPSLSSAVTDYLLSLPVDRRAAAWPELAAFARWYGGERSARDLTPVEVGRYLGQHESGADRRRLESLRAFFAYLEKVALVNQPLATAEPVADGSSDLPPATEPREQPTVLREDTSHRCPARGEEEALRGRRRSDHIAISCERCGHTWRRSLERSCPKCGGTDLVPGSQALVERVRGNQTAIVGAVPVYRCPRCDS